MSTFCNVCIGLAVALGMLKKLRKDGPRRRRFS